MKLRALRLITCALGLALSAQAEDRYATLIVKDTDDVQELTIEADQTATLAYFSIRPVRVDPVLPRIEVITGKTSTRLWWSNDAAYRRGQP